MTFTIAFALIPYINKEFTKNISIQFGFIVI